MTPKKHYKRLVELINGAGEEKPDVLVRLLPQLLQDGALELLLDEETTQVFQKLGDDIDKGRIEKLLKLDECSALYSTPQQLAEVRLYEHGKKMEVEKMRRAMVEQERAGGTKVGVYYITSYRENGDTHVYLDINLPFDFKEEDVKHFVADSLKFDNEHNPEAQWDDPRLKTRVSRVTVKDGGFEVMDEYKDGRHFQDVEALGLRKGDYLHVSATVPTEDIEHGLNRMHDVVGRIFQGVIRNKSESNGNYERPE